MKPLSDTSYFQSLPRKAVFLALALTVGVTSSANALGTSGVLRLRVIGAKHDRGKLVARLFRETDNTPRGKGYRETAATLTHGKAALQFTSLPFGTYALFLFHDENGNGVPDHNFLGMPTEPMGFSRGFRVSLFSGIPDFDDLSFRFDQATKPLLIEVR